MRIVPTFILITTGRTTVSVPYRGVPTDVLKTCSFRPSFEANPVGDVARQRAAAGYAVWDAVSISYSVRRPTLNGLTGALRPWAEVAGREQEGRRVGRRRTGRARAGGPGEGCGRGDRGEEDETDGHGTPFTDGNKRRL
jgi:hypothetical protein